ncbi:H-NS histone family protein [Leucothrix sargassi]|nr:H-NS histone family protein [Leucothrix sargassi]
MSTIDYDKLSRKELLKIMKEIPSELKRRDKQAKKDLREQMLKLAEDAGYSLDDVLANTKPKATKKAAPKYQNPDDAKDTWSGRGRKPLWVIAAMEAGLTLEDIAIKD